MSIFDIFKRKKTNHDELLEKSKGNIVKLFRSIGEKNNMPPTNNLSDQKILEISNEVMNAFKNAAENKGEVIPAGYLLTITFKFFIVYETVDEIFYKEHLQYEVKKYLSDGLRPDYQKDFLQCVV